MLPVVLQLWLSMTGTGRMISVSTGNNNCWGEDIMATIFHLVPASDWEAAQGMDDYAADSLESEGFIHCSKDHPQVLEVANRLFHGRDDMLVLELDIDRLVSPIKHEAARSGTVYPHIYGKINADAVIEVLGLTTGGDGQFNELVSG